MPKPKRPDEADGWSDVEVCPDCQRRPLIEVLRGGCDGFDGAEKKRKAPAQIRGPMDLLHVLWSTAQGQDGYNKELWVRLEAELRPVIQGRRFAHPLENGEKP